MIQSLQVRSSALVDEAMQQFRADVLDGLSQRPKQLSPKYFYDRRGSLLFDAICDLDEYYLTRTELAIMRSHAADIAASLPPEGVLLEFGSGSSVKTRLLLDELSSLAAYVPIDISGEHLLAAAYRLQRRYQSPILPVVADFTKQFLLPSLPSSASRTVYFPGSTIGNFEHFETKGILQRIASLVGIGGRLLIGIDLQKDAQVIEAAYNDRDRVTAEFNLNLLHRINAELDGDFQLDGFVHEAVYDPAAGRIEMRLRCTDAQTVHVAGKRFDFQTNETIHTEYSYKYTIDGFAAMAAEAGFRLSRQWTDDRRYCAVLLLENHASSTRF
jgi:dimethylhistidine N-methyltransferase